MDSTGLRLVLLVAGIILIVGIYGWDKIKKRMPRSRPARKGGVAARFKRLKRSRRKALDEDERFDGSPDRREPVVRTWDDEDSAFADDRGREPVLDFGDELDDLAPEPEPVPVRRAAPEPAAEPRREVKKAAASSVPPPQVLVVHVAARVGARFTGDAVMAAARGLGMEVGSMDVFQMYDEPSGEVLFNMANMVNPGTFPLAQMSEFSTPGVAVFAQLPGPLDPLSTYDLLLETVERLAAELDGRLLDEQRRPLTREARGRMRMRLGGAAEE